MDTLLQEQILWDAAMGYLLVRDAIYSLNSVNTYDSVEHAYEMLDEAVKVMTGKGKPSDKLHLGQQRERDAYGFVTSSAAIKQKEALLETFFEQLKVSGDIEACLRERNDPIRQRAEAMRSYTGGEGAGGSRMDELLGRLEGVEDDAPTVSIEHKPMRFDIKPPKD
jgi:hypothetical protein